MATIQELIPPPPRPPHPAWLARVNPKFNKSMMISAALGLVFLVLISLQFFVGEEVPLYSRLFIIVIAAGPLVASWLVWSSAAKERREALEAWANWTLSGMKGEAGKLPSIVDPSDVSLTEVLAGRDPNQYYVLVDPKFRFSRRKIELDFLQELSEKPSER
jgi:hypothetical protein